MVELTGYKTKTRFYICPDMISSFHKGDHGTVVYMKEGFNGIRAKNNLETILAVYNVKESAEEIQNMILTLRSL
jgi:hypothetical protein